MSTNEPSELSLVVHLADRTRFIDVSRCLLEARWRIGDVEGMSHLSEADVDGSDWVISSSETADRVLAVVDRRDADGLPGGLVMMDDEDVGGATFLLLESTTLVVSMNVARPRESWPDLNNSINRVIKPLAAMGIRVEGYRVEVE